MWFRLAACLMLVSGMNTAFGQISMPGDAGSGFVRFDNQAPWLHGFRSHPSPFTGHASFRPSNYKQAIARAGFMEAHSPDFWQTYGSRPTQSQMNRYSQALSRPSSVLPVTRSAAPANGQMSLIRSIRVAEPATLPSKTNRRPQILRAIQREETGPLFPLPF